MAIHGGRGDGMMLAAVGWAGHGKERTKFGSVQKEPRIVEEAGGGGVCFIHQDVHLHAFGFVRPGIAGSGQQEGLCPYTDEKNAGSLLAHFRSLRTCPET